MIDWMRRLTKRTAPMPRQEIDPSWPPTSEEIALREARTEEALARRHAMNVVRAAHRTRTIRERMQDSPFPFAGEQQEGGSAGAD